MKPKAGVIRPNDFQLVLVQFKPKSTNKVTHNLRAVINYEPDFARTVTLIGSGVEPTLVVEEIEQLRSGLPTYALDPPLFMKPTCTGLVTSRNVTLRNPTRVPVLFQVMVPPRLANIFVVTPSSGLLRGNQSIALNLSFAPKEHEEYKLKLHIRAKAVAGKPPDLKDSRMVGEADMAPVAFETLVTVVAPGTGAVMTYDPPLIDFHTLLVNTQETLDVSLYNHSDSDIQYELHHLEKPQKLEVPTAFPRLLILR